jgi:hypothetical protein
MHFYSALKICDCSLLGEIRIGKFNENRSQPVIRFISGGHQLTRACYDTHEGQRETREGVFGCFSFLLFSFSVFQLRFPYSGLIHIELT